MSDPRIVLAAIKEGPLDPKGIALVRKALGLTQAELARIFAVHEDRVSQIERGKQLTTPLEADVLMVMRGALARIRSAADAAAYGRRWAAIAAERGPLSAIMQILADGATWRGADR